MPNQNKPTLNEILDEFLGQEDWNKTKQAILRLFDERYIGEDECVDPVRIYANLNAKKRNKMRQELRNKLKEDGYIEGDN